MAKISLDTNAYASFKKGDPRILEYFLDADTIFLSAVMVGELFAGFRGGNRYKQNVEELEKFLRTEDVQVLDVTIETAEIFGEVKSELRLRGKMIPLNDIWIVAHALETGSKLITFDSHFKEIPGLRLWEGLE